MKESVLSLKEKPTQHYFPTTNPASLKILLWLTCKILFETTFVYDY